MDEASAPSGRRGQSYGAAAAIAFETRGLAVFAGSRPLLRSVTITIPERHVFGIIGPSGAGKTTLLRCLNRMIELDESLRLTGDVLLHGRSIFASDADDLRARVGMIFQQPVVFPLSIYKNVLFGVRHLRRVPRAQWPALAERALREAALWDEVKDRLHESALHLSVGQQQRLCMARALAVDPEVILLDEPTSALDRDSTQALEELILRLAATRTIVLVTHNLGQARRVADTLVCIAVTDGAGEVSACGPCADILRNREREELDVPTPPVVARGLG
ncbi:MAG: phosphate ABC transporter ATP-binding protein [Candidatus Binatia bacterium]